MSDLYAIIGTIVGLAFMFGGAYFKGNKDGKANTELKHKKTQLASKAKEATLNEKITENNEEIDGLDNDAVDDELRPYFRDDNEL